MKRLILVLLLLDIIVATAKAATTGNQIQNVCKSDFIDAYVKGLEDKALQDAETAFGAGISVVRGEHAAANRKEVDRLLRLIKGYCVPEGATIAQISSVFCRYLEATPAERHKPSAELFNTALSLAWPCPK